MGQNINDINIFQISPNIMEHFKLTHISNLDPCNSTNWIPCTVVLIMFGSVQLDKVDINRLDDNWHKLIDLVRLGFFSKPNCEH